MGMQMSEAAKQALINAKSSRQGTPTGAVGPAMRELFDKHLIGVSGGLTASGSIMRDKLVTEALDKVFG